MDPAVLFRMAFYLSKIIRIGIVIGFFRLLMRLCPFRRGGLDKPTRLQTAGGA